MWRLSDLGSIDSLLAVMAPLHRLLRDQIRLDCNTTFKYENLVFKKICYV